LKINPGGGKYSEDDNDDQQFAQPWARSFGWLPLSEFDDVIAHLISATRFGLDMLLAWIPSLSIAICPIFRLCCGLQTAPLGAVTRFRELSSPRTCAALGEAQVQSDSWGAVAKTMLGLTAAVFLGVLYFVLRRRVAVALIRMTGIVSRLAKQDYDVEVPRDRRRDEIGEINEAIHIFRENGLERDRLDAELRRDQQAKDLILQMMHRLQACQTQDELAEVVALFAPQIFPGLAGHLYVMNDGRTMLTRVSSRLDPHRSEPSFPRRRIHGPAARSYGGGGVRSGRGAEKNIATTPLSHRGRILGSVSVSIGVASSPAGGSTATRLMRADAALLDAKARGRNMTVSASSDSHARGFA
jgi:HAMP domain-containing protein